jgi:hypothetical protein
MTRFDIMIPLKSKQFLLSLKRQHRIHSIYRVSQKDLHSLSLIFKSFFDRGMVMFLYRRIECQVVHILNFSGMNLDVGFNRYLIFYKGPQKHTCQWNSQAVKIEVLPLTKCMLMSVH